MTPEDAFVEFVNTADERELCLELRDTFIRQRFERHEFGCGRRVNPFFNGLGLRGGIATFRKRMGGNVDLARDRRLVEQLPRMGLAECYYGAACYPIYPFLCPMPGGPSLLTAKTVLAALGARRFRSAYTPSLDETSLPHPGYHPGTDNDEVHTDFAEQNIFGKEYETVGAHGVLKRYVEHNTVWYVLAHTWPHSGGRGPLVTLLAVGKSPHGDRLVGVLTHQMCRNLCD